jgi:hypothetical protein
MNTVPLFINIGDAKYSYIYNKQIQDPHFWQFTLKDSKMTIFF